MRYYVKTSSVWEHENREELIETGEWWETLQKATEQYEERLNEFMKAFKQKQNPKLVIFDVYLECKWDEEPARYHDSCWKVLAERARKKREKIEEKWERVMKGLRETLFAPNPLYLKLQAMGRKEVNQ